MKKMRKDVVLYTLIVVIALGFIVLAQSGKEPASDKQAAKVEAPKKHVSIGQPAPDFTLPASDGKKYSLSQFKGKYVVLEWYNHQCPYVRKHYDTRNMQKLQNMARKRGAVWLSVISSAPGKEGYLTAKEARQVTRKEKAKPKAVLLDSKGEVGKLYHATNTPQIFIIKPDGTLGYMGAVDNRPSADKKDVKGARNYVRMALTQMKNNKKVSFPVTKPYGCSVKY